jgi:hypothetical protein
MGQSTGILILFMENLEVIYVYHMSLGIFFHFEGVNMEDILTGISSSFLKHSKFGEHLGNTPYLYV